MRDLALTGRASTTTDARPRGPPHCPARSRQSLRRAVVVVAARVEAAGSCQTPTPAHMRSSGRSDVCPAQWWCGAQVGTAPSVWKSSCSIAKSCTRAARRGREGHGQPGRGDTRRRAGRAARAARHRRTEMCSSRRSTRRTASAASPARRQRALLELVAHERPARRDLCVGARQPDERDVERALEGVEAKGGAARLRCEPAWNDAMSSRLHRSCRARGRLRRSAPRTPSDLSAAHLVRPVGRRARQRLPRRGRGAGHRAGEGSGEDGPAHDRMVRARLRRRQPGDLGPEVLEVRLRVDRALADRPVERLQRRELPAVPVQPSREPAYRSPNSPASICGSRSGIAARTCRQIWSDSTLPSA